MMPTPALGDVNRSIRLTSERNEAARFDALPELGLGNDREPTTETTRANDMPNPYGAPEISVQDVHAKQQDSEEFILVDVREPNELELASLPEDAFISLPLSELRTRRLDAVPEALRQNKDAEVVIFCHKGLRSAQVTVFLRQQGWSNVVSMAGGIDAWAEEIDETVGTYVSM